ncbi:tetratricopeptide repeat protein, partial [Roseococcus sp. YIM B11640]|uniref:tetratricopeptide repeat protein n=1 Tax=Roseococcus sp. YIM B11640 TaxID=3133973 RepID=UPI003C7ACC5E
MKGRQASSCIGHREGGRDLLQRGTARLALLLLSTVSLPALAQSDVRMSGGAATTNLVEQAQFWQQQGQPERALQAYERLLAVEPNNVDALAGAVEMAALANQSSSAQRYLAQLRRVSPQDPRLPRVAELVRLMNEDAEVLASARGLAAAGRGSEAVARYRELFRGGNIPSVLAPEYYQALAGSSEAGYREAVQQLSQRTAANPSDQRLALTYAQILTYREDSRAEGIVLLQELSQRRGMREAARFAWRQAVMWLGPAVEATPFLEAYAAAYPNDSEVQSRLREVQNLSQGALTPLAAARIAAWSEMERRQFNAAEQGFQDALKIEPNDVDSMIGLALVRINQRRQPEARRLYEQAIAIAPDRTQEFGTLLGFIGGGAGTVGAGTGVGWVAGPTVQAWRLLERGDLDGADRL